MNSNLSFEDLVEQFLDCCRNGGSPKIEEYVEKYPEHKQELLEILPLLQDLEDIGANKKTPEDMSGYSSFPDLGNSDYKIIKKIGIGGMGIVFEALQVSLDRKIAVKLLSRSLVPDTAQREQFEKEAKIIAMLHHPNIVKIYSAKCTSDCCYYAMELINGKGLNQCKIYDIREIGKIALQTAKAISYAHSCNIMHRDIKPANLLLDKDGQIHVSDFGLAFALNDPVHIEAMDLKSGTIRYMAPEKLIRGNNSFLTDQYSFGVTLYELVTKTPFLTAINSKELINKICKGKAPQLVCKNKSFAAIVNKCTSFNPENRYRNMDEVAEDIERFLNDEPVQAANYTPVEKYNLWKKRQPSAAFFSLVSLICIIAFIIALIAGYIQTSAALALARRNANTADTALTKVFSYLEKQTPSASGSVLLDTLLPYYQEIARQKNQPKDKLIQANKIVGLYAMRSGNYKLAEKSYRRLSELTRNAYPLNKLAEALENQGRTSEAVQIREQLISKYSKSNNSSDKLEVVRALQTFPDDNSKIKAFDIIKSLLEKEPSNPEYLYRYAMLTGDNPRLFINNRIPGIEPDAIVLLNTLAKEYPDNPEYGIAIVRLMSKKLKYSDNFTSRDWGNLNTAFDISDKLLARFPNTPGVVTSVVELKTAYIRLLRSRGDMVHSRKETEQLLGMLELLFYNPETPNSARESLIDLQLDRLRLFVRDNRTESARSMSEKLRKELSFYQGSRQQEFQRRFSGLMYY